MFSSTSVPLGLSWDTFTHFSDTLASPLRQQAPSFQDNVRMGLVFYLCFIDREQNQKVEAIIKIQTAVASASWIPGSFSAHRCTCPAKKKKYSKFPSPLKLVMGSGTDAFTTWNINFFIRPKVLGVNSLYCMRCQGNYGRSALFLRTLPSVTSPPVYGCTSAASQCFHSAEVFNRKGLDNVRFSNRRSGVGGIKSSQAK